MPPKKLIIDCDVGTDDAQAILMALAHHDLVEIVAITTVFGNTTLENTTKNTLRLLNFCDRLDIPVYQGYRCNLLGAPSVGDGYHGFDGLGDVGHLYEVGDAQIKDEHAGTALTRLVKEHPGGQCDSVCWFTINIPVYAGCGSSLLGVPSICDGYHGIDGLGDVPELYTAGDAKCQTDPAPSALCSLSKKHQGEITLLALGPLTNVATAIQLDPSFGKNLKDAVIMGGNTTGRGNKTCCAEFNFFSDPEAAQCVLNNLRAPITLLPLELCEEFSFSWEWYEDFCNTPTDKAAFVKAVEEHTVTNAKAKNQPKYWCWDQLAAAVAIDPKVITESRETYATVELQGTYTRGQVVVDWRSKWGKAPNITLVTSVDEKAYEKMLFAAIGKE